MLVDVVGSAVIYSLGSPISGVSVEINASYFDAAYLDVSLIPSFSFDGLGNTCFTVSGS